MGIEPIRENNKVRPEDGGIHGWFRFVLSYPPHLVRHYLERFSVNRAAQVLDPFCGTGTTLVECKKLGIPSTGIEASPSLHFASSAKLDWPAKPKELLKHARGVGEYTLKRLKSEGISDRESLPLFGAEKLHRRPTPLRSLPTEAANLLLKDSISPLPLHKVLTLLDAIDKAGGKRYQDHERLALAKTLVFQASNLHFGPEVGVKRNKLLDAPVVSQWLGNVLDMAEDISNSDGARSTASIVHYGDSRYVDSILDPESVDAVITSPPYPNEKDYTRTTRLESVLLGFVQNKQDLRRIKRRLVRSNTRGVYKSDDDDLLVKSHPAIQRIARQIEQRRIKLGKTSGFERLYGRVTELYFGGMLRHLSGLRTVLRPGARLAYVVGDQASYLRIMIHTGQLLADIADSLGYVVEGIDLFRTRLSTATRQHLREEVVLLGWPG